MHNELRDSRLCGAHALVRTTLPIRPFARRSSATYPNTILLQIENNMLPHPPNRQNAAPLERPSDLARGRFQRLRFISQPNRFNRIPSNALSQPSRNRFHFRRFRHWRIDSTIRILTLTVISSEHFSRDQREKAQSRNLLSFQPYPRRPWNHSAKPCKMNLGRD